MSERLRSTLLFLSAPLAGALGGLLASLANWPLPWMTGSLLAVILLRCSGCLCNPPPGSRQTGQLIVACAIGLHFTTPVFAQKISHLGLIVLGACGTFLLSLIGINLLTRAGYDRATAYFASMPGGASEMAVIGARHSAGIANVVAAHSLRLLMVVLLIPALFTWSLPAVEAPPPLPTDLPTLAWLIPLGTLLALHLCGQVDVYGFRNTNNHYYPKFTKNTKTPFEQRHNWDLERECIESFSSLPGINYFA